jgi:hypothetical protein
MVCERDGRCDTETRERKSEELSHFLQSLCNASYLQAYVLVIYVFSVMMPNRSILGGKDPFKKLTVGCIFKQFIYYNDIPKFITAFTRASGPYTEPTKPLSEY